MKLYNRIKHSIRYCQILIAGVYPIVYLRYNSAQ